MITSDGRVYFRCYDGCPDTEFKQHLDHIANLRKKLKKLNPDAHCTYFPMEEKYRVFVKFEPIGIFDFSEIRTLETAIEILEEKNKNAKQI